MNRTLDHPFLIADVGSSVIGADFLSAVNILVDLSKRRLVDGTTNQAVAAFSIRTNGLNNRPAPVDLVEGLQVSIDGIEPAVAVLLKKYPDILRPNFKTKGVKHNVVHHIKTNCPPISTRPRRLATHKLLAVKKDFEDMMQQGICKRANSPWSSAITVVPKRNGDWRPCGDYRALNAATLPDKYPVPHIQDFNQSIGRAKVFGTIDLVRAYHQIPVAPEDVDKTTVTTPFGNFSFFAMPFGLRNAAQTFQRFMDEVLRGLDFVYVYIDDILIFSQDEPEHIRNLDAVFRRLDQYGITINTEKSHFIGTEVDFLGYRVSAAGIRPLPEKVTAISNYPQPRDVKQLLRFLGFINFYRTSIPRAAELQIPLYAMTDGSRTPTGRFKNNTLVWTDQAVDAFAAVKKALADAVTLSQSLPDAPIALFTDASDTAMGGSLNQLVDGSWQPIGFFSRKFTDCQKSNKYSPYSRELLAIKEAIAYFRHQVETRDFAVYTDHKPLTSAFTSPKQDALPKTIRDLDFISQFTTDIRYVPGPDNAAADALSRIEAVTFNDYTDVATAQLNDPELQSLLSSDSAIVLKQVLLSTIQPARTTRSSARNNQPSGQQNEPLLIWVNECHGTIRPYIPASLRRKFFDALHSLSHPGVEESVRLVTRRVVWPGIKKTVRQWAKACVRCQTTKVSRHTIPPAVAGSFIVPDDRFAHVDIDIIHLPPCSGFRYCLTAIDRFTRWPEAWPIAHMTAETVADVFFREWVGRFGCPAVVTTDQGRSFESQLMSALNNLTGSARQRTTSYNPKSNGLVERLHRPLKAAIMAHNKERWVEALPIVLLGLRSSIKSDVNATPAQMVYGTTLRLPGEFFSSTSDDHYDPASYVCRLRDTINRIIPRPTSNHAVSKIFVPTALADCSHVFVRVDRVRQPLEEPYDGPFPVIRRNGDLFTVRVSTRRGEEDQVLNMCRLKPAFMDASCPSAPTPPPLPTAQSSSTGPDTAATPPSTSRPDSPSQPAQPRRSARQQARNNGSK